MWYFHYNIPVIIQWSCRINIVGQNYRQSKISGSLHIQIQGINNVTIGSNSKPLKTIETNYHAV